MWPSNIVEMNTVEFIFVGMMKKMYVIMIRYMNFHSNTQSNIVYRIVNSPSPHF